MWFWIVTGVTALGSLILYIGKGRFTTMFEAKEDYQDHLGALSRQFEEDGVTQVANVELAWGKDENNVERLDC